MAKLIVVCLFLYAIFQVSAWSFVPVSDEHLVRSSHSIVHGIVEQIVDSQPGVEGAFQHYKIRIDDVLKNDDSLGRRSEADGSIIVSVPGGYNSNRNMTLTVPGAPAFDQGERVLLFVHHGEDSINHVSHLGLGAFHEVSVSSSGTFALRSHETRLNSAGPDDILKGRRISEFSSWIKDLVAADRQGDQDIVAQVSSAASYISDIKIDDLRETMYEHHSTRYNIFKYNNYPVKWASFDSNQAVYWKRYPSGQSGLNGGGYNEIVAGFNAWNNEPNTPISYYDSGITYNTNGLSNPDGVNSIVFEDPKNYINPAFSCNGGGTLAVGGWWTNGRSFNFRGVTYSQIAEADIVVQNGLSCWLNGISNPSPAYANMITHEIGHTLGLAHSCGDSASGSCVAGSAADNSIMRAYIHPADGAKLGSDDQLALQYLYSTCFPYCRN